MLAELWEQENLKQITLRSRYGLHWRLEWDWEQKRLGDLGTYMVNIKSKLIIKKKKQKHFTTRLEYIYKTYRSTKTTTRIGHTWKLNKVQHFIDKQTWKKYFLF